MVSERHYPCDGKLAGSDTLLLSEVIDRVYERHVMVEGLLLEARIMVTHIAS